MSTPATMRALQQTSRSGPRDLRLITDAPVPSPGPGEVLIRVTAAGVNFVDISQARGTFAGGPQPPYLAGIEGAGEVTATGEGVTAPEIGANDAMSHFDRLEQSANIRRMVMLAMDTDPGSSRASRGTVVERGIERLFSAGSPLP